MGKKIHAQIQYLSTFHNLMFVTFFYIFSKLPLGLTGRAIGYYEAEERCPAPDTLNKIADFFNVSIDWLFGRTDIRTLVNIITDGDKVRYAPYFDDDEVVSSKELYEFLEKKSRKNCR